MKERNGTIPSVAVVTDLCGLGRCSLREELPVLSVMGIQAIPLPTAVLSSQTGGYDGFTFCDLSGETEKIVRHWVKENSRFDAILTGFFSGGEQIRSFCRALSILPRDGCMLIVDPVMGDCKKAYTTVDQAYTEAMRELAKMSDFITPNETEAALLCGLDPQIDRSPRELASALCQSGYPRGTVTGITRGNRIGCALYSADDYCEIMTECVPAHYPGTGDLFAAVFCGELLRSHDDKQAASRAVTFIREAVELTRQMGTPNREGVVIEPLLHKLIEL